MHLHNIKSAKKKTMYPDYSNFVKEDFLQDDFFIRSVKYPDEITNVFWISYLSSAPRNLAEYTTAKEELEYIITSVIRIYPFREDKKAVWEAITNQIPVVRRRATQIRLIRRWSVAASIVFFLAGISAILYNSYYAKVLLVHTPYNLTREVILPDSTRIILNANSNIKYAAHWKPGKPREVWLDGEAYFEVNHKNKDPKKILTSERFLVHAGQIEVQVLGTVFNIKSRIKERRVTLVSGKLAVRLAGQRMWRLLRPAESIQFGSTALKENSQIIPVDPALFIAWKDRSVILPQGTRIKDIIPQLEDNYGIHIQLGSTAVGNKALEGTLPLTNQDNLFFILSNVLKINITKQDSVWIFNNQQP